MDDFRESETGRNRRIPSIFYHESDCKQGRFEPARKPVKFGAEVVEDVADLLFGLDQRVQLLPREKAPT